MNNLRLRLLLTVACLLIGIAMVNFDKNFCALAGTCDEAFAEWMNAGNAYESARLSYFYGLPVSCADQCALQPNVPACIADCQITRNTALGAAEVDMFSKAMNTCTPLTVDQCAQASAMAQQCLVDHPYLSYTDPEESMAVYAQFSACRLASKVDSCM